MVRYSKLRVVNGTYMISIPKDVWSQMDIKEGDRMKIELTSKSGVTVTQDNEKEAGNGKRNIHGQGVLHNSGGCK